MMIRTPVSSHRGELYPLHDPITFFLLMYEGPITTYQLYIIFWRAGCGERVPIGEMVEFRILSNSMKNAKQTVDSDESDQ